MIDGEAERGNIKGGSFSGVDRGHVHEKGAESWKQGGAVGSNLNMVAVDN